jgi:glycerophosphoryl diester phosphodiesterase
LIGQRTGTGGVILYFATGIDGVFTDQPDTGVLAREDFLGD